MYFTKLHSYVLYIGHYTFQGIIVRNTLKALVRNPAAHAQLQFKPNRMLNVGHTLSELPWRVQISSELLVIFLMELRCT